MPQSEPISGAYHRGHALGLLRGLLRDLGWRYRVYLPLYVLLSAVFLLPPQLLKFFTREIHRLSETSSSVLLSQLAIFGALIAVCLWLGLFLSSLLGEWLRLHLTILLRSSTLESVQRTNLDTLTQTHRGDWLTRMTGDLHGTEFFLADGLPEQVRQGVILLGSASLFAWHTGPIALLPCLFAVALAWLNVRVHHRMAPILHRARDQEGRIFQFFVESLEGFRTIRAYHGEATVNEKLRQDLAIFKSLSLRIIRRMGALTGLNDFAAQAMITLCLACLTYYLTRDRLTVNDVLVYPFYLGLFLGAAKALVAGAYEWNRFFIEGGRLGEIHHLAADSPSAGEAPVLPSDIAVLEAQDLSFRHPGSGSLFERLSLRLPRSSITAITGPSGSGKSTLLEILAGLRNAQSGSFRLGEQVFAQLPLELSAFVEQRPYLFAGSFRDNLRLGLSVEDDALQRALGQVDLATLVTERGGLDGTIADQGQNLSEGQRYRLALARALAADRPLLLLDEPFAPPDPVSVDRIIALLREQSSRGRIVVLVTHVLPPALAQCHPQVVRLGPAQPATEMASGGSRG